MEKRVLVGETETAHLALYTEDGKPVEFYAERKDRPLLLFNVYRAKVENVKPNGLAFLNLGQDGAAVANLGKNRAKAGDLVTVTVTKDFGNDKYPYAEIGMKFRTPYAMYGTENRLYVSGKLNDSVKKSITDLCLSAGLTENVTFRTRCGELGNAELLNEIQNIKLRASEYAEKERRAASPVSIAKFSFRERAEAHFNTLPEESESIDFKTEPYRGFLAGAAEKKIVVEGIGNLILEQTEAFVSVDVNSGAECRYSGEEENAFRTNLGMIPEIARAVRLRNYAGTILVDAVSMRGAEHKEAVLQAFREAFRFEKGRTEATGYTKTGVYEIVREREGIPLSAAMGGKPC